MDFGAKNNIARSLNSRGCEVTIYPAHTSAEEIIEVESGRNHVIQRPWRSGGQCIDIIEEVKKLYDNRYSDICNLSGTSADGTCNMAQRHIS